MPDTRLAAPAPLYPQDRGTAPLDPPAAFAQWREDGPIRRVTLATGTEQWLVTRYDDIRAVLSDPRVSSDQARPGFPLNRVDQPAPLPGSFISTDPPVHDVMRRMLTRTFMIKNVERMRPALQRLAEDLLEDMAGLPRPADLIDNFALPLPSLVICELFGVPYADRAVFQRNSQIVVDQTSTGAETGEALAAMSDYLTHLLEKKDRDPGDDLFSELAVRRVRTGELTREQAAGMGTLLLIAGHETTANMIGLSTVALLRHPEQRDLLLTGPQPAKGAIEELLRYLTIVHLGLRRVVVEDMEVGGVTLKAGDGIVIPLQSANRDPSVFDVPDHLDLGRDARRHVAFGYGIHQCLGQPLARAELQIALPALFTRFPGLAVAVPYEEIAFKRNTGIYGIRELPVTW